MTPMLNNIFEVSAILSKSFNASSNSLLSYRARAVTQVSISYWLQSAGGGRRRKQQFGPARR